jgi:hypothetical protein
MPKKGVRRLLLTVGAVHLLLVALGAASIEWREHGRVGRWLAVYSGLSGADAGYGFFAPGVGSQVHAVFDVQEKNGHTFTTTLESHSSQEANLRVGNITDQFADFEEDKSEELTRSLSASLAGTIFGRYPRARTVTVRIEQFTPVDMKEFREGKRPRWEPAYSAVFAYLPREEPKESR